MAANDVPTVRHRRLAAELRRLRESTGLSAEEVVSRIPGMNLPKLSRYENARVAHPKADVVGALLDVYECDADLKAVLLQIVKEKPRRGWWQGYSDALNLLHTDLITLEASAIGIKTYEASFIPGLFQTRSYAQAIFSRLSRTPASIPAMIDVRIARQAILSRAENPVTMWAVIHESALSANMGEGVMVDQLDRLISLCGSPNIKIQIMESAAPPHPGMNGAYTLLEFPARALDVVLAPGHAGSRWEDEPERVEIYRAGFNQIIASALNLDDSHALIIEKRDMIK
ncbi:transcriptional regulator with XRE-family HTH domain [Kitasatospora sp. GAS204A]|uniref:helix-turn-helix domain-containing protein n=1 Tax=unclassified Kitasatospora TaxID=2633591 RepID=UPI002475C3D8|nr:helix-turn-helix transcriptional regulator [Kitasatospora sp. GAS204B]MDH6115967.1 transcriptional regulator with XRE-family HTH domain [Kitasatospora sp. GAS204B]